MTIDPPDEEPTEEPEYLFDGQEIVLPVDPVDDSQVVNPNEQPE